MKPGKLLFSFAFSMIVTLTGGSTDVKTIDNNIEKLEYALRQEMERMKLEYPEESSIAFVAFNLETEEKILELKG